jgi:mono/diheme cytochrome c family protein
MESVSKRRIGIIGKALVSLILLLSAAAWNAARAQTGIDKVYLRKCAVCHGQDGAGKTTKGIKLKVPDARSPDVQKMSDAELVKVVTNGKGKDMAGFGKELTKAQIEELVKYYRGLAK